MFLRQANLTNANLEGALATGNTSFKGSIITGAGMDGKIFLSGGGVTVWVLVVIMPCYIN